MMDKFPLVSIYTLTYNCEKTILETLESIYSLTYSNIELVISDDASTDNTLKICDQWVNTHRTRFDKVTILKVDKNTGVSQNFHRAIKACRADWIKGVAGDDALYPDCIEHLMNFVANHPEARMIYGKSGRFDTSLDDAHFIEEHGSTEEPLNKVSTARQQYEILLCWACIDAPTVFYHKSVFEIPELQNCGYAGLEDYPLFLRFTKLGNRIYFCDELICKYRKSPTSLQNTSNYNNLITKSYLQHFFKETHSYYKGLDKIARYGVNVHDLVCYKCKNRIVRRIWEILTYPIYWVAFKMKLHYDYNRINNALAAEKQL